MYKFLFALFFTFPLFATPTINELLDTNAVNGYALYHPDKIAEIYAEHAENNETLLWSDRKRQLEPPILTISAISPNT